jgi:hypothetical protein
MKRQSNWVSNPQDHQPFAKQSIGASFIERGDTTPLFFFHECLRIGLFDEPSRPDWELIRENYGMRFTRV